MRLTLRTLLAYVDDILEPSQAREIGQKLQESEVARDLLDRLKDVVRRRRLGAPDIHGPDMGIDPNTVAEYLDNTLSPTSVADVERICLESDLHLAEVVACHQILTLVLGEPVHVSKESRERIYALGPLDRAPQAGLPENGRQTAQPQTAKAADDFESKIPDYLRRDYEWRRSWLRKAMPFLAVGLVACLWVALVILDPSLNPFGGNKQPDERLAANGASGDPNTPNDDGSPIPAKAGAPGEADGTNGGRSRIDPANPTSNDPMNETVEPGGTNLPPGDGIDPPPPGETGIDDKPPIAVAIAPGDGGPEKVDPDPMPGEPMPGGPDAKPGDDPAPAEPVEPPVAQPQQGMPTNLVYEGRSDVLLHTVEVEILPEPMGDQPSPLLTMPERRIVWKTMKERGPIHGGERLACPEPFEASIVVPKLLRVDLLEQTRIRVRPTPPDAAASFELERGRVVVERIGGDPDEPVDVEVVVHGRRYALRLDSGARCGVIVATADREGHPFGPTGYEEPFNPDTLPAGLFVAKGNGLLVALDLEPGEPMPWSGRSVLLRQPDNAISLMPKDWPLPPPGEPALLPLPDSLSVLPDWVQGGVRVASTVKRSTRAKFSGEFGLADRVTHGIEPTIKHDDPLISQLAVRTLGLIEAAPALVNALATGRHPETRQAALEELRFWMMGREPDDVHATLLEEEFPLRFPEDERKIVYELLWGFDEEDARDVRRSRKLLGWMAHDDEVVRRLAFFHVRRLTGRDLGFQPHDRAEQRMSALGRWEREVDKTEGALLDPSEAPAETP